MNFSKLTLLILTIALMNSISTADASILTFDNISSNQIDNYGNFNWVNIYVKKQEVNAISGKQVAYNGAGLPALINRNELFNFNSAYLSAFNNDVLNVTVYGYNINIGGNVLNLISSLTPKYSTTIALNEDIPTLYTFNYENINTLVFVTNDNKNILSLNNNKFAMDNFTYNKTIPPAPEPSAIILGFLGLSGLIGLRKKL